ncbi:pyridoxal phosphate-dependent aminotransferase [Candidatus Epulonipiscium viviparus]|uniref:pyridoxal phosphate-dependent aminotransferase n=1 Tax=Candidatus Epulonipiscium viviparus TaxID=420336 RepID=UPI002738133C|nr:pyridoxal phosphate-dependent aminotransferase [Candidatus Epulopiscium viviparus]
MKISNLARNIAPSSTLAITAKAKELKESGIDVVGFGAGEPDFDTPLHIAEAAKTAIDNGFTRYTPASGIAPLKAAVAKKFAQENGVHYEPSQIVVSNGAKHSLMNAFTAIISYMDEVILPAPYWLSYPEMIKIVGGVPVAVATQAANDFKITPDEFRAAITDKTCAIVLNSPSNPTGVVYTKDELQALADVAVENDLWIISDEIYEYLVYDGIEHVCVAGLSDEIYNHTITINGLSKGFAMTGWRIGFLAAPQTIASTVANIQSHSTSNPNSIAQMAALAALSEGRQFVDEMQIEFAKRRDFLYGALTEIKGFKVVKPHGAFYCFVDISDLYGKSYNGIKIDSAATFAKLLLDEEAVALVPCADFAAPTCVRFSYAIDLDSIKKGVDRVRDFVHKLQ